MKEIINAASLKGVFGPVTTPFGADGELDLAGLERNIASHLRSGLDGVVVTGSTGEAALLDEREREQVVASARRVVPSDKLLMAGIGAESTRATLKYARTAAKLGADAVLVVAPHYFGSAMTEVALRTHYLRVADDSPLPVVAYNIPKYMHFRLSNALIGELAAHDNVIGIKDSSGDRDSLLGYLEAQTDRFTVVTGNGPFWQTALALGARGGILAFSLFLPEAAIGIRAAMMSQDVTAAEELQRRVTPAARTIVNELGPAGVKAALDVIGLAGGAPRPPLLALSNEDQERVRQLMHEAEQAVTT